MNNDEHDDGDDSDDEITEGGPPKDHDAEAVHSENLMGLSVRRGVRILHSRGFARGVESALDPAADNYK